MNKNSYIFSLDIIRILALFGVIAIHTANAIYTRPDFFGGTTWWITIILDTLSRISIPLFIMVSGYLILRKDESFKQSLRRGFYRVIIPLVFWYCFYIWYGGGFPSFKHFKLSFLPEIFYGNMFHLYFLVIIIGLYFLAPLLRTFQKTINDNTTIFFTKILLAIGIILVGLQFIFQACGSENFFSKWIPYAGYFVVGFVWGNKVELFNRKKLTFFYCLSLIATFVGNYLQYFFAKDKINLMASPGCLSHYSDHYLSINVVIMSITAFLLLLKPHYTLLKKNSLIAKIVQSIARATFGIYLIHPFIARFLEVQFHFAIDFSPLPVYIILFARLFLIFIISFIITTLSLKIPVWKMVFGGK